MIVPFSPEFNEEIERHRRYIWQRCDDIDREEWWRFQMENNLDDSVIELIS